MKRIRVYVLWPKDRPNSPQLQWGDPDTGLRKSKSVREYLRDTETAWTGKDDQVEKARADLEYELNHGTHSEPSKLDWDRFRQLFADEYLAGLRPRTREKYETVLDVFEEIMKPSKLRAVTERTLSLFLKGMRERKKRGGAIGLAPMTMKNYLVAMRTALAWAVGQRLLSSLPTFPVVKVPKKKPRPVPTEAFEKLLAKAPTAEWKAFLLCGWWAGLRLSEAAGLEWEASDTAPWVDFERNRIVLPATFAKSGEDQWVPLHQILKQALASLPRTGAKVFALSSRQGGRLTRSAITNYVLLLAKKAGVRLGMHKLRKGFGCRAAKQLGKGNAPILHELMRHSSMQITMDYYASVNDVLQEAIEDLK